MIWTYKTVWPWPWKIMYKRKAAHPWGGVNSSNPCRPRGCWLHHHDGGVC
jgi:hypothetical protein